MAVATKDRRFTRSRKTTVPDDFTEKPEPRSLRSSKPASSDFVKKRNCIVVISKLKSEDTIVRNKKGAKRITTGRKRTRVDSGEENEDEEETNAKKTRAWKKNSVARERASNGKEAQSTSKQRPAFTVSKVPVSQTPFKDGQNSKKSSVYTEQTQSSSSLSDVESENQESSSDAESESGMASSYKSSSLSSSSSSDRESDSPLPTSELSSNSSKFDSSSDESSSSSSVITWRTRKSPRKQAQAKSRKKIAELCKPDSEDSLSPSSGGSSYSE